MADERDGVFDVGTFDNARFDSVYATSNASIFSASGVKALLKPSSFLKKVRKVFLLGCKISTVLLNVLAVSRTRRILCVGSMTGADHHNLYF